MALLLAFPLALVAQQRIAVINTQEIMTSLPDVKTAETKIQELAAKYEADIKGMQDEFRTKAEAFVKERDSLPETIRNRRQQEIQDIEVRIQNSYQQMQENLQKEQQTLLAPIQAKIQASIKRVAEANSITYVLESGIMLAIGKDAIDLTSKVLADLGITKK